jgi:hypothetical protein
MSQRPSARGASRDEPVTARPIRDRLLFAGLALVFGLSFVVFSVLSTVQTTVLDEHWYQSALAHTHAYDRVYNEVLPDPKLARETRDLLAGLPVDRSLVSANVRLVLPPATLKAAIDRALRGMTRYLRGEDKQFDPIFALQPIFDNIREFADVYLSDGISRLRPLQAANLNDFAKNTIKFANDLGAGRKPAALPTIPFTPAQATGIENALLQPLDPTRRQAVELPVRQALAAGDVSTALAALAPEYARQHTEKVIVDLRQDAHGTHFTIDDGVKNADDTTIKVDLTHVRFLLGTVMPLVEIGAIAVAIASLYGIGRVARRRGRSALLARSITAIATGLVMLAIYVVVRLLLGNPFSAIFGDSSAAPTLHALLGDLANRLFHTLDRQLINKALIPVIAGGVAVTWQVVVPRLRAREIHLGRRGLAEVAVAGTTVVVLIAAWLVVARPSGAQVQVCNGHAELCDRRYDNVAYATTHNAMSVSDQRWISANQDVPIPAQLDSGVHALLIDTHYWETSAIAASFAATLPPEQATLVLGAIAAANPPRPGAWLCHQLCRFGATPFLTGLRQIRTFVHDHPNDVFTLVIEDAISNADTVSAFEQSGLVKYVFTPNPDPQAPWPTLRTMIKSGKRVVVFAERAHGPAPWYVNFSQYAMETPYTFSEPSQMSCVPNRGGTGKQLFLMNNWIQRDAPSRSDAGTVNATQFLVDRARRCTAQRGNAPNFVAVDFSTIGGLTDAVDELNGVRSAR